jgi:uncharacterized protein (TIGR00369 family)
MDGINDTLRTKLEDWVVNASDSDKELMLQVMEACELKNSQKMHTYISAMMKMEKAAVDDQTLVIEIPNTPFLENSLGIMHGGLTSTLLDSAMGTAANLNLSEDEGAVTLDLNIRFLSPGIGERFKCEAKVVKTGRQIIVTEGTVWNEKGDMIASATGTFFKIPRRK